MGNSADFPSGASSLGLLFSPCTSLVSYGPRHWANASLTLTCTRFLSGPSSCCSMGLLPTLQSSSGSCFISSGCCSIVTSSGSFPIVSAVSCFSLSRARQCLTGACLAPKCEETFSELQARRPQFQRRELPPEALEFEPETPVELDRKAFFNSLRSAPCGSSAGPGGCTCKHLKLLLDDSDATDLLVAVCNRLAQGKVPEEVRAALTSARLTAWSKPDGGIRGIATGCTVRRLVARAHAKQFKKAFEAECAPFQYALFTKAGTDCVGHMLRAATDANPSLAILSVDGIGAYDHILRSAMLERLHAMPEARSLLPFVRMSYGQPSTYQWSDERGERSVTQAEGGEQGDPLMPLLCSIGIQGALEEVATALQPGEQLCAFLDDENLLCEPSRVKELYVLLADALIRLAGIHLQQGKTRAWNRGGNSPDNIADLGPEVWQPGEITVLGTPIGSELYVSEKMDQRIAKERALWEAISTVPDLQCAWQILLQSANPRANHTMRTMPPGGSADYCRAHDEGIWATVKALMDGFPAGEEDESRQLATLPMRIGGLGLRSAVRCALAAHWASWSDALHMISQRTPHVAGEVVGRLSHEEGCLGELRAAASELDCKGFWWRPSCPELHEGRHAPRKQRPVNQANGLTVGSNGLLPSSTRITGRTRCSPTAPPLVKLTCALTLDATPESCSRTPRLLPSAPCLRTCSESCCWNDCSSPCR